MFKRMPAWLIGGVIGVLYFLVTLAIDFYNTGLEGPASGLFIMVMNIPSVFVYAKLPLAYRLSISITFQIISLAVINFLIGAVIGLICHYIAKHKRR